MIKVIRLKADKMGVRVELEANDLNQLWLHSDLGRVEQVVLSMLNHSVNSAMAGSIIKLSLWTVEPETRDDTQRITR